ncbi:unnamed protein product, partial [Effrenium voratum]
MKVRESWQFANQLPTAWVGPKAAFDLHMDDESLIHAVQNVEQMLTTGGGWQDQVGAILGGAKIARSGPLPLRVLAEPLPLSRDFAEALEQRLVLVFTG